VTRRTWHTTALVAGASLALSACSVPFALSATRTNLGGSQYLQLHASASLVSTSPTAKNEIKLLKALTFDVNEQSAAGIPIASSLNHVNTSVVVWHGHQQVMTLVTAQSNVYLSIDFAALAKVPGVTLSSTTLSALDLVLGNRWIELPYSLVAHYSSTTLHVTPARSTLSAEQILLTNAFVSAFALGHTTTTSHGFIDTGTLASLVSALGSVTTGATTKGTPVKGTYRLTVTMAGTKATQAQLSISSPTVKYGNQVININATIAHQRLRVSAPGHPLVITSALLKQLGTFTSTGGAGVLG